MAYTIPVAALVIDLSAAERALELPAAHFENPDNRWDAAEGIAKLTGAPVEVFSDEEGDIFYIGIRLESNWRIDINGALVSKAAVVKTTHPHPLVQSAQLAVVSEFC